MEFEDVVDLVSEHVVELVVFGEQHIDLLFDHIFDLGLVLHFLRRVGKAISDRVVSGERWVRSHIVVGHGAVATGSTLVAGNLYRLGPAQILDGRVHQLNLARIGYDAAILAGLVICLILICGRCVCFTRLNVFLLVLLLESLKHYLLLLGCHLWLQLLILLLLWELL